MYVAFQAKYYVYCTHGDVIEYLISCNALANMSILYILFFLTVLFKVWSPHLIPQILKNLKNSCFLNDTTKCRHTRIHAHTLRVQQVGTAWRTSQYLNQNSCACWQQKFRCWTFYNILMLSFATSWLQRLKKRRSSSPGTETPSRSGHEADGAGAQQARSLQVKKKKEDSSLGKGVGLQRQEYFLSPVFPKSTVIVFHWLKLWVCVCVLFFFDWPEEKTRLR